jgi:hypothetical protein
VLAHPRIELPDSAVWDIHRGRISDTLLAVMARAADEVDYGVVVLDTGHPWEIFGTDRQSDHTRGRAVDIYRVGDRNVVDDRADGSAPTPSCGGSTSSPRLPASAAHGRWTGSVVARGPMRSTRTTSTSQWRSDRRRFHRVAPSP